MMVGQGEGWPTLFVLCLGAGVYEELLFRLAGFTLLSALFIDLFKMPHKRAVLLMVLISALLFSEYHYPSANSQSEWNSYGQLPATRRRDFANLEQSQWSGRSNLQ